MKYKNLVQVFFTCIFWDIVLRLIAEQKITLLKVHTADVIVALRPFYKKYSIWESALIAGMLGIVTSSIIAVTENKCLKNRYFYLAYVFGVSAVVSASIRFTNVLPYRNEFYYKKFPIQSLISDGLFGFVVALSMLSVGNLLDKLKIKLK